MSVVEERADAVSEKPKVTFGVLMGGLAAVVTLVGGVVAIIQYLQQTPCCTISGQWTMENTLEKTSDSHYHDMKLTYFVALSQNGTSFSGTGEKTGEQLAGEIWHELRGNARVPIEITGTVSGLIGRKVIRGSYIEHGTKRETRGEFYWELKDGSWVGHFNSTAADSEGSSLLKH